MVVTIVIFVVHTVTISDALVPVTAIKASHSGLVRRTLNFRHRPSHRLREVEESEEKGRQEHRAKRNEAVRAHGSVHMGPDDDDYKIERPVHLTGYTHCGLHVPMDIEKKSDGVKRRD